MKLVSFVMVMVLAGAELARPDGETDDGRSRAHLNYGRGCAACHAPHSARTATATPRMLTWLQAIPCSGRRCRQPVRQDDRNRRRRYVEVLPSACRPRRRT